jgi:hypothetical protein
MKTINFLALSVALFMFNVTGTQAQNLVVNSNFTNGSTTGWSTSSSMEVNPQNVYGGPSSSVYVTEVDNERTLNQQVCILPGLKYSFTYQVLRRPQSGTPSNPGIVVKVTGVSSHTNYVNNTQNYNNTTWSVQTKSFTVTIPSNSSDKKINIQFASTNNTSTYGVLVWDIELAPASSNLLSIDGPTTSGISTPNNFSVENAPESASYNWTFSDDANHASSTNSNPGGIKWPTIGNKTVAVALSNGSCAVASYSQAVTISTILPIDWTSFSGAVEGNDAHLTWISQHESNGKYFLVTRSIDGVHFDSIGVVASMNVSANSSYQYIDRAMPEGNVYYRICHVDLDGATSFSRTISLNHGGIGKSDMHLYPNPAASLLNIDITSQSAGKAYVQIFNPSGVLMSTSQAQLSAGANHHSINIAGLGNGSYFLKVVSVGTGLLYTKTFVKI